MNFTQNSTTSQRTVSIIPYKLVALPLPMPLWHVNEWCEFKATFHWLPHCNEPSPSASTLCSPSRSSIAPSSTFKHIFFTLPIYQWHNGKFLLFHTGVGVSFNYGAENCRLFYLIIVLIVQINISPNILRNILYPKQWKHKILYISQDI